MSNSYIWLIDWNLSGSTTSGRCGTPHCPNLHYYMNVTISLFSIAPRTLVGGVLPLGRDAVSEFYNPNQLGRGCLESYQDIRWGVLLLNLDAVCVFYSQNRPGHSLGWGLTPLQRSSRCILQPQPTGLFDGRVLPLCREAVGIFYSPSRLGWDSSVSHTGHSLRESSRSTEMQSVHFTLPTDLTNYTMWFAPFLVLRITQPRPVYNTKLHPVYRLQFWAQENTNSTFHRRNSEIPLDSKKWYLLRSPIWFNRSIQKHCTS